MSARLVGLLLGGILGMANAEAALLSSTIYPEMRKDGYEDDFAACFIASVSVVGPLIPPGLLYVIYGVSSGTPIAYLFEGRRGARNYGRSGSGSGDFYPVEESGPQMGDSRLAGLEACME